MVAFALSKGVAFERITEATGLKPDGLARADAWMPEDLIARLWQLLDATFPGEPLTFEMAEMLPLSSLLGELHGSLEVGPDFGSVLRTLVRNRSLLSDTFQAELIEGEDEVSVRFTHAGDETDRGGPPEVGVGCAMRACRSILGDGVRFLRLEFRHQPRVPVAMYQAFYGAPVSFGRPWHAVVFHRSVMDLPNPRAEAGLAVLASRRLDQLRRSLNARHESDALATVREALASNAAEGEFSGEALASRLKMSLRSLQRRVKAEGTSLRTLLTETRRLYAEQLVRDESLSIDDVAFQLGYSDERSFRRAFERWTGQTPAQARRKRD